MGSEHRPRDWQGWISGKRVLVTKESKRMYDGTLGRIVDVPLPPAVLCLVINPRIPSAAPHSVSHAPKLVINQGLAKF